MENTPSDLSPQKKGSASKIVTAIVLIVVALVAGLFLFTNNETNEATESTASQTPQTTPMQNSADSEDAAQPEQSEGDAQQAENTIAYTDSGFMPRSLTVSAGDTVTVINRSSRSLEFSSDVHPTHTNNPEINQSTTAPGETTTFTVTETGTHGFHDHLNASRTGTLIVE